MAMQREVKGGPWTTGHGGVGDAGLASLASARRSESGRPEDASGISVAEALHLLGRRGYVRSFEPDATALWCRSSETRFDPSTMIVESVTAAADGTVLALRDTASGTAGTWILAGRSEWERPLLGRLTWSPSAIPIRRSAGGGVAPTLDEEEAPTGWTA